MNAVNPEGERREKVDHVLPKACPSCGARYPADALFCSLDGAPLTTSPAAIAAAAATDPYVGREILGHIEIRQLVGIGAMGRVYRAFQRGIDRDVAVKILHRELSANQTLVARFHREAKVASRLAHPNVVHVLLVGQLPDGAMYIVMEYLDGMSLQSALAAVDGAMPLPRALHIALQLSEAAGEAHAQSIVHRDLKPENVMLVLRADDPDYVKVLDFGIARLNWDEPATSTAAGLIFGTARYISPEGAQGERVGPQGDVYSIATIVYQMLTGRTPFDADQAVALLVQQIHNAPTPMKDVPRASYVPDAVAAVVMKNLAKKPEDRATDARAFGRALLEAAVSSGLSAQDILARPSLLGAGRGSHVSVVQMPSIERTKQLTLEPDVAARIGAESAPSGRPVVPTAFETPSPQAHVADIGEREVLRTEISDPLSPQSAATTRWSPPAGFGAKLVPPPMPVVDATLDDRHVPLAPAVAPGRGATVLPASPPSMAPSVPPPSMAPSAPAPSMAPAPTVMQDESPSRTPASLAETRRSSSAPSRPALRAGPKLAGPMSLHARRTSLVVGCFLLGAALAGLFHVGSRKRAASASAARAERATPAEENVEPLASTAASVDSPVPPLTTTLGASPVRAAASATAAESGAATTGPRLTLEVSHGRPGIGQPVDFAAHVVGGGSGARKVETAKFTFSGPGLPSDTVLAAADDGSGIFRTTFTFLQSGRFDVRFSARVDGTVLGTSRTLGVGAGVSSPAPEAPAPATAQTGKWL